MAPTARGIRAWIGTTLGGALVVSGLAVGGLPASAAPTPQPGTDKVEAEVLEAVADDAKTPFWVRFADRPDLVSLAEIPDWEERGRAVHQALTSTADASQAAARSRLDAAGVTYRTYAATNAIYVPAGTADLAFSLASLTQVEGIYAPRSYEPPEPQPAEPRFGPAAVEWGVTDTNAPQVWSQYGSTGEGIVVANIDTGVQWDHPALIAQYRGSNGDGTASHDYSWLDATGQAQPAPWDWDGHGTHTMGTMVGDDGGDNQIGVAPGARWIAAAVSFSDESLISAGEWMLAPTDLNGQNPDPDLRPHIINNSWGSDFPSNDPFIEDIIEAWAAAGQMGIFANGNAGPECETSGSPGSRILSYSVGSHDINHDPSIFSSRGPGQDGETKPNISAPGEDVRSAVPGNDYAVISGTSMASPHVAGAVALLWSAGVNLIGDTDLTRQLLDGSAIDTEDLQCGGTAEDNNVFGEGRLDALALLDSAPLGPVGLLSGTVTDATTGEPIAGVRVAAVGTDLSRTVRTGGDGTYSLLLSAGDYEVTASRFGYVSDVASVTILEDQTVTHDVALAAAPTGTVTGTVTDGSGQGWPLYARVSVGSDAATFTDPETGVYALSLPVGTHTLQATSQLPGYLVGQAEVTVTEGGETVVDFALVVDAQECVAPGYTLNREGLVESFDTEELPAGWAIEDLNGSGGIWTIGDPYGISNFTGGEGLYAVVNSDFYGPEVTQDTVLVTPPLDLSGQTAPIVEFKQHFDNISAVAAIELSVDGGATWDVVWEQTGLVLGPRTTFVDLAAAAGEPDAQVRFRYTSVEWDFWWQVDDVFVGTRSCDPLGGGLVVGYVQDDRAGDPIINARVRSLDNPSDVGFTRATPADDNLDDGFYWLHSALEGARPFEASASNYGAQQQDVTVEAGGVVRADFVLPSADVLIDPTSTETTVVLGESAADSFTVTNTGTATAELTFSEVAGDFVLLRANGTTWNPQANLSTAGAPVVSVPYEPSMEAHGTRAAAAAAPDIRPAEEPWTDLAATPAPIMDNRMVELDGLWYSIGGTHDFLGPTDAVWRFDPVSMVWEELAPLPQAVQQPAAAAINGQLVVAGGWLDSGDVTPATWLYDPATDAWSSGSDMPVAVSAPGQGVVDGLLYVVGGCTTSFCEPMTDTTSVYDPAVDAWTAGTPYPADTAFPSCGGLDGSVVCTGGVSTLGDTAATYQLDPAIEVWNPLPDAPAAAWGSAHAVANEMLVVNGGVQDDLLTNASFGYSVADGTWVSLPASNGESFRSGAACGFVKTGGLDATDTVIDRTEWLPGFDLCGDSGADVPWLVLDTTEAVLEPGASVTVGVVTDSSAVTQPGTYTAGVRVRGNLPVTPAPVEVTMTVTPPTTWGKIDGTASILECDGVTIPMEGITVTAVPTRSDLGAGWVLTTDTSGYYARWVNDQVGELELTAVLAGYFPEHAFVVPVRGQTVTTDFELLDTDCVTDPGAIPPEVHRIEGANRYATAAQVSQAYPPGTDTVFVATGQNFPDALAAASRAGSLHGPVLLTRQASLPAVTAVELGRLEPANVVVVGGTGAISAAVVQQIRTAAPGATVTRYAGADRYETAALLAADVATSDVVYVASGTGFADALAGSARAGALDAPILLVKPGSVPASTAQQLQRLAPQRIVLLGGTAAVSAAVETQLGSFGTVERVFGSDRYGTAAALAEDWPTARDVYVATGLDFPDALSGSALAAHTGSPVLLVRTATVPPSTLGSLQRLEPARIFVLGGQAAVTDDVLEVFAALR